MSKKENNLNISDTPENLVEVSTLSVTVKSKINTVYKWVFVPMEWVLFIGLFVLLFVFLIPSVQEIPASYTNGQVHSQSDDTLLLTKTANDLQKQIKKAEIKLKNKTPKTPYLTISTVKNEYVLYKKQQPIRYGKCSTGSYIMLDAGENQKWMFKTPKGEFHIRGKTANPLWKKPDWAFIEEGLPVPSANHYSRYEYGVLGDYALSLGDGYLLHGTLYKRYLGLAVTHGCVRLNDADLEAIYTTLDLGAKVYIF